MRKFFLKHCVLYRKLIKRFFGNPNITTVSIPWEIYGNFDVHYLGIDETGYAQKGFKTLTEALRNKGDLSLTVMYDKY